MDLSGIFIGSDVCLHLALNLLKTLSKGGQEEETAERERASDRRSRKEDHQTSLRIQQSLVVWSCVLRISIVYPYVHAYPYVCAFAGQAQA